MDRLADENILFSSISHQGDARERRGLLHTIKEYYSHTEYQPTREQIEKNRYVFFGLLRCRPWMAIPAGILIQFCYGSVYAWSIFNGPINRLMTSDPNKGGAEVTFYIALGVLGITAAICGPWIETSHPRKSGIIGLVIFFSGHLTSALAIYTHMISLLYFGYGFIAGIGLGIGYVSTIDAVSKWWPSARGTAAGCAVMGFGGGSLAFSAINKWLIEKTDLSMAFLVLGLVNFALMLIGVQFINPPPPGHNPDGVPMIDESEQQQYTQHSNQNSAASDAEQGIEKPVRSPRMLGTLVADQPTLHVSLGEALRSRDYWLLYVAFLANIVFCLVIISNLPRIIDGLFGKGRKEPREPPLPEYVAVSIEGGFNMVGRVMVGLLSDVLGRKTTFLMLLLTQILVLIFIPVAIREDSFWGFLSLVWVATVCYGGGFGMIPAFLADMFGSNNTSSCHGIILTAWSIASVGGGLVFTGVVNHYLSHGSKPYESVMYTVNFMWMLALAIVGFVCCLFVRASIRDRMFPALPNQVIRIRIFGRVLRVLCMRNAPPSDDPNQPERCKRFALVEYLTKAQEQAAWEEYLALRSVQYRLMKEPNNY